MRGCAPSWIISASAMNSIQLDRDLQVRALRRGAAAHPGQLRQGDGGDAADPGRGAAADLFAVPARQPALGQGAAGQGGGARRRPRAPSPMSRKTAAIETVPVTGGHCKLQWKPDMGMRWAALGVDYEMYGKDHLAQAPLYDAICKIAGGDAARAVHVSSCSWTTRARRFPNPRATASPSTNG